MKPSSLVKIVACLGLLFPVRALSAMDFFVYFGTYTGGASKGIYMSRLDLNTGQLSAVGLAATTPDPSYLAVSPNQKCLYAANEVPGTNSGLVSSFQIDKASGRLEFLNQKDSGGASPCHVSVDTTGRTLLVANYTGGSIKSIPILEGGRLGDGGTLIQYQGRGVNPDRQTSPHGHYLAVDPTDRFALGCDLGTDKVMIYRLKPADSTLAANDPPFGAVPPGSGPRHLTYGSNWRLVFVLNEMGCSITPFKWDPAKGELTAGETVAALPSEVAPNPGYTAAEILRDPSGRYIYATLRGHDSISVFAVDEQTGGLKLVQNISSGGNVPRGLGLDPTGRWLLAANQKSGNVVEFAIDPLTGKLTPTQTQLRIDSVVDVKFAQAD